jgi:hypothetical protein
MRQAGIPMLAFWMDRGKGTREGQEASGGSLYLFVIVCVTLSKKSCRKNLNRGFGEMQACHKPETPRKQTQGDTLRFPGPPDHPSCSSLGRLSIIQTTLLHAGKASKGLSPVLPRHAGHGRRHAGHSRRHVAS